VTVDAERWRRIENLFLLAVEKDAAQQAALLDERCGDDGELRLEVERLLTADRGAASRLSEAVSGTLRLLHEPIEPGTRLGAYEILDLIGEGGMGCVYRARRCDEVFEKQVAIKVVRHGLVGEVMLRRFERERRIMAQLDHPFIARVFDGGSTADGWPYLVMEYVDGRDLLEYADEHQLDLHARLGLFCQVCEAVEWAHQRQIVHRDL
jgi:serine/threonine protein kinase